MVAPFVIFMLALSQQSQSMHGGGIVPESPVHEAAKNSSWFDVNHATSEQDSAQNTSHGKYEND